MSGGQEDSSKATEAFNKADEVVEKIEDLALKTAAYDPIFGWQNSIILDINQGISKFKLKLVLVK